jgi:hypothetical protein
MTINPVDSTQNTDPLAPETPTQFPSTLSPTQDSPGITDYVEDAGRGVVNGTAGFFSSAGKLANDVAGLFGGSIFDDQSLDDLSNVAKPKTLAGNITSGITQFLWGFVPGLGVGGAVAKAAGLADAAGELTGAGGWLARSVGGGIADAVGFDGHQQRLSNLIQQFPSLQNPVTDFLQSKDDDSWASARIKSVLEGFGVGSLTDGLLKGLQAFKGLGKAVGEGDAQAATAVSQNASQEIAPIAKSLGTPTDAAAQATGTTDALTGGQTSSAGLPPAKQIPVDPASILSNFTQQVRGSVDPTTAVQNASAGFLNHANINAPTDVHQLMQSMVDELKQNGNLSTTHSNIIQSAMDQYAAQGDSGMVKMMQQDSAFAADIGARNLVYRNMNVAAATKIIAQVAANGGTITDGIMNQLKNTWAPIASATQQIQTGIAQALNAMAIPVSGVTPEVSAAMDKIENIAVKGVNGPVQKAQVSALLQSLATEPDNVTQVFQGLAKLQGKVSTGFWDAHNRYFMSALLWGAKTQTAQLFNNLSMSILQPAQRILGGALTGDTQAMASGARMYMGLLGSAADVFRMTKIANGVVQDQGSSLGNAFRRLLGPGGLDREGIPDAPVGGAFSWLSQAVQLPMKMLDASDKFFNEINARAYMRDEAIQAAQRNGITGDGFAPFVANYMKSGYDDDGEVINQGAKSWAEGATFTQELDPNGTPVQRLGASAQTFFNKNPVLKMFVPFIRTPTNILNTAIDYTPGLNLLNKTFQSEISNTATRADSIGRMYVGGLFWTLAAGYGASGMITGAGPQDPDQKQALQATGWRPYSYVSTDDNGEKTYTSYNRFDPFGMMFGLAADFSELTAHMDDQQRANLASTMTMAVAKNLSDKTYFKGIQELVEFISGEKDPAQLFAQRAGEYVPTLLSNVNDDPDLHDIRSVMDGIKARIPGLSDTLPPRRNLFGEPTTPPNGYLPWGESATPVANAISPAAFSKQVDDPVKQELANLQFGFGKPSKIYGGMDLSKWVNPSTGQDAYDRLQELTGQVGGEGHKMSDALSNLIGSRAYQSLPQVNQGENQYQKMNNPRIQAVNSVIGQYRQMATYQMLREYPQIATVIRQQKVAAMTPSVSNSPIMAKLAQIQ